MINALCYFIPFFVYFGLTVFIVRFFRAKFGVSLPISFFSSTIIVFVSQLLFRTFYIGIIIVLILSILGYYFFFTNKVDKKSILSSYGFIAFIVIYITFTVVDFNKHFVEWDEFMHWGPMIKEMYRLDKFYYVEESSLLIHKDYPPFLSLFEMIWIVFSTRFSEGSATQALHIISFSSAFVPWAECLKDNEGKLKKIIIVIIFFLVFFGFISSFDTDSVGAGLSSIYTDLPIALIYAYILYMTIIDDDTTHKSKFIFILLCSIFLGMAKQIAITLVLLGALIYLLKEKEKERKFQIVCLETMCIFIFPMIGLIIWRCLINRYAIDIQFDVASISIESLINVFRGNLSLIQKETSELFINKLINGKLTTGIIKFSYISFVLISLMIVSSTKICKKCNLSNRNLIVYILYIIVGSVCYALSMYVLYMFCFSEDEMLRLACWERYFNTYILSLGIFDILFIYRYYREFFHKRNLYLLFAVAFVLFINFERYEKLFPQAFTFDKEKNMREASDKIISLTKEGDTIFLLDSYGKYDYYVFNYYLDGRYIDTNYMTSKTLYNDSTDIVFWNNFITSLKDDDYVFVYTYDLKPFNEVMSSYTNNGEYYQGVLYKVSFDNNQLELIYVE